MEPKFIISEVFSTAWKGTKSQLWILAGLLIGYCILSFTLTAFAMPMQSSIIGKIIVNVISALFSIIFSLGYMKNIFQALDGEEPQFSAYGQQTKNIITYFLASLITGFVVLAGFLFFIIPGIYLALRLQFFQAFIIEENAGIIESLHKSWEITKDKHCSVHSGVGNDRDPDIRMYFVRYRNFRRRSSYLYDVWLRFP